VHTTTVIPSRSARSRTLRRRPMMYAPLALFSLAIAGGLAVLVAELPGVGD